MATRAEPAERSIPVARMLVASFVATSWAMLLVCRFQLGSRLSWRELFLFPLVCIGVVACVHALAVWVLRGLMDRDEDLAAWPLIHRTWSPVVWVPALMVLAMDRSVWVAFVLPLIVGLIAGLIHRYGNRVENQEVVEGDVQSLFIVPSRATLRDTIFPWLVASVATQLGLMALLRRWDWVAGFLMALTCVLVVSQYQRATEKTSDRGKTSIINTLAAVLFMAMALVPFLKPGPGSLALANLLAMERMKAVAATVRTPSSGAGYSGIILTLPPKPHEAVLPPAPSVTQVSAKTKTQMIKFDGVYWYFREPDERPRRDARIVQGDPLKAQINSTNSLSLLMEAHQALLPALKLDCCSALDVNVVNADTRSGPIFLEVVLKDTETKMHSEVSLGTIVVPSSKAETIDPLRAPVQETVTFQIPHSARGKQCSEITVRIKRYGERAVVGSRLSVEGFVLAP